MRSVLARLLAAACVVAAAARLGAQSAVDTHLAAAKAAAGTDHPAVYERLCAPVAPRGEARREENAPPPRDEWYQEPKKVFDNLYYVGMKSVGAWAVTTSDGIILLDALYDYSVEESIVGGLKKLGLDPGQIKYVIVTHAHGDHVAGAKYLQDRGARILMSAEDWHTLETNPRDPGPRPKRDMIAADGQKLTLGGTTVTMYVTPGHTTGTLSLLVPVKDGSRQHVAAEWGGTLTSFAQTRENYDMYINSAQRFRDIVAKAGADVLIANHTPYDRSIEKMAALSTRKPGDPHPFVVGQESTQRFMQAVTECAKANKARAVGDSGVGAGL